MMEFAHPCCLSPQAHPYAASPPCPFSRPRQPRGDSTRLPFITTPTTRQRFDHAKYFLRKLPAPQVPLLSPASRLLAVWYAPSCSSSPSPHHPFPHTTTTQSPHLSLKFTVKTTYTFADLADLPSLLQEIAWHRYQLIRPLVHVPSRQRIKQVVEARIQTFLASFLHLTLCYSFYTIFCLTFTFCLIYFTHLRIVMPVC